MRHEPTSEEAMVWERLRRHQLLGLKFRRQHAIERFIVDFYCGSVCLVIEIDGSIHRENRERDAIREEFLKHQGLRVLRFTNDQVRADLDGVMNAIADAL
jgi:very-short-patch-repair endonuclease